MLAQRITDLEEIADYLEKLKDIDPLQADEDIVKNFQAKLFVALEDLYECIEQLRRESYLKLL